MTIHAAVVASLHQRLGMKQESVPTLMHAQVVTRHVGRICLSVGLLPCSIVSKLEKKNFKLAGQGLWLLAACPQACWHASTIDGL